MSYEVIFTYQEASATLTIWEDEFNTATLSSLSSKYRKRRTATVVLKKALEYVDMLGLDDLYLEVGPFGDEPRMSETDLKAWYMSHDFYSVGGNIMVRARKKLR